MPDAVVLVGPEPLRRARARNLAPGRRATVDCDEQPHLLAELLASNGALFPVDAIHARSMSALTLDAIREVNTLLREATVLLVRESDTFPVAHERALVNATGIRIAGGPGTLPSEYRQIAGLLGTHISPADAAFLDGRTGGDPASAVSVLEAGAAAGLPTIDRQLIETLASGPEGPGLPWLLLEWKTPANTVSGCSAVATPVRLRACRMRSDIPSTPALIGPLQLQLADQSLQRASRPSSALRPI
jgi:hypothetical protein